MRNQKKNKKRKKINYEIKLEKRDKKKYCIIFFLETKVN